VPIASILVGLFDMAGNAIKNLAYLALSDVGSTPVTPVSSIQNYAGNVWWVSPAGAVQITNGNTLNASALKGITGDYGGGNPAEFRYVNADKEFYAYQDFAGGKWGFVGGLGLDVFGGLTSAVKAHVTYGGAGTINLVLPPALPAGPAVVMLDNTGAITTTANPTVALTMGNNTNVVLSGSGHIVQGQTTKTFGFVNSGFVTGSGSLPGYSNAGLGNEVTIAATNTQYFPLNMVDDRNRIVNVKVNYNQISGTAATLSLVGSVDTGTSGGLWVGITGASGTTTVDGLQHILTLTPTAPGFIPTSGNPVWIKIVTGSGTLQVGSAVITYDIT